MLIPSDVDVTSVVVTFKNLVVVVVGGGVVVETAGIVALNPFVFSLERSGAAKEEERGRRNRASIIIAILSSFLLSCSLRRWRSSAFVEAQCGIYTAAQAGSSRRKKDKSEQITTEVFQRNQGFKVNDAALVEVNYVHVTSYFYELTTVSYLGCFHSDANSFTEQT